MTPPRPGSGWGGLPQIGLASWEAAGVEWPPGTGQSSPPKPQPLPPHPLLFPQSAPRALLAGPDMALGGIEAGECSAGEQRGLMGPCSDRPSCLGQRKATKPSCQAQLCPAFCPGSVRRATTKVWRLGSPSSLQRCEAPCCLLEVLTAPESHRAQGTTQACHGWASHFWLRSCARGPWATGRHPRRVPEVGGGLASCWRSLPVPDL